MSFISLHDLNKKPQTRTDLKQFVLFQQRFHICFFLLGSYWTLLQKIPLTQLESIYTRPSLRKDREISLALVVLKVVARRMSRLPCWSLPWETDKNRSAACSVLCLWRRRPSNVNKESVKRTTGRFDEVLAPKFILVSFLVCFLLLFSDESW